MRTPQARALQRTLRSKFNTASPGESRNRLHDHGLHCRQSGRQSKILDCLDPASPTSLSSIRTLARGRAYAYAEATLPTLIPKFLNLRDRRWVTMMVKKWGRKEKLRKQRNNLSTLIGKVDILAQKSQINSTTEQEGRGLVWKKERKGKKRKKDYACQIWPRALRKGHLS
eukprot:233991-Pelagomonas_calceolata.AAC.1